MEKLGQCYRVSTTKGSAPPAQGGQFRPGRRYSRVAGLEIGTQGLADEFGAGARLRLADLLELPHHRWRQGNRHGLCGSQAHYLVLLFNFTLCLRL